MTEYFYYANEVLREFLENCSGEVRNIDAKHINGILRERINRITVYYVCSHRIGHLAENTDDFLRHYYLDKDIYETNKEVLLLLNNINGEVISNYQLLEMIHRVFPVISDPLLIYMINILAKDDPQLWNIKGMLFSTQIDYEVYNSVPSQLFFTEEEEQRGKKLLEDMGIEDGAQFICFNNRDKAYLNQHNQQRNWSYHDHRDSNIDNCILAAKYFQDKGYYCIRMGHTVEKPLETGNSRIIEYASNFRSDFGDIYLAAKCKFWFGSASGIICVSSMFNVPTVWVNVIPFGGVVPYNKGDIYIPKKLWYKPEKRFLTYRELYNSKSARWGHFSKNYEVLEIEVIENTPEEILECTKEMYERLEGTWKDNDEDEELQNIVRSYFEEGDVPYNAPSRIGTEFLRKNKDLFI